MVADGWVKASGSPLNMDLIHLDARPGVIDVFAMKLLLSSMPSLRSIRSALLTMVCCAQLATPLGLARAADGGAPLPGPTDLQGQRQVGRIDAKSGQMIENVDVSNPNGPCIIVPAGVTDVTIRHSRIGPCGPTANLNDYGVLILDGASNITIQGNVIHDVGSGVKAFKATNPLVVERNFFYNIRGPLYNGQAVQFNSVDGGSASSRISCNVSDANYGDGHKFYEDHISLFKSSGTPSAPIEVAFNRIRGGVSKSGGGITVGDKGGGWIYVHDNVVVTVPNSGIGVAGGSNIRVENNRVDNRGRNAASLTHNAYYVRALSSCSNITIKGNRGIARLWNWKETRGDVVRGYRHGPEQCSGVDDQDNSFGDDSLSPDMFSEALPACR